MPSIVVMVVAFVVGAAAGWIGAVLAARNGSKEFNRQVKDAGPIVKGLQNELREVRAELDKLRSK